MTLLKIAQVGEPMLRQRARAVTREELVAPETQRLIDDMIATMRDANGAGLAAPQVYVPVQICVIEVRPNNPRYPYKPAIPLTVLVNPVLTPLSTERFANYEGCLSVPDLRGVVQRCPHIRVEAWDRDGNALLYEARGLTAGTHQHECDHLDGRLFVDGADPATFATWKAFERFHQQDFARHAAAVVERWGG